MTAARCIVTARRDETKATIRLLPFERYEGRTWSRASPAPPPSLPGRTDPPLTSGPSVF
jgi:hypothetical protein